MKDENILQNFFCFIYSKVEPEDLFENDLPDLGSILADLGQFSDLNTADCNKCLADMQFSGLLI